MQVPEAAQLPTGAGRTGYKSESDNWLQILTGGWANSRKSWVCFLDTGLRRQPCTFFLSNVIRILACRESALRLKTDLRSTVRQRAIASSNCLKACFKSFGMIEIN